MRQLTLPLAANEFQLRRSARAKRLRVSINPFGIVEVVAPKNVSSRLVSQFVDSQLPWIKDKKRYIDSLRAQELNVEFPETVVLSAIGENWKVRYKRAINNRDSGLEVVTNANALCLSIKSKDQTKVFLKSWLNKRAKESLLPWLAKVSEETGIVYSAATVRGQKTRWASCSSRKNISLNRSMLFLNPDQVRYLMIHELCHTKEMNHSRKFWQLVAKFSPNYKVLENTINESCYKLPRWAF